MATRHSSKSRRARGKATDPNADRVKPSYFSPAVVQAIDTQRRALQQADSALGCLALALQEGCEPDSYDDPDYSDVARAVRGMLRSAVEGLEVEVLLEADKRQVPDA